MKLDLMRLRGIDNPEKYLVNPESPEAQQAAQMAAQMQQQAQQEAQQKQDQLNQQLLQTQIAEIQRNWESDIKDRELDAEKFKEEIKLKYAELEQKYYDTNMDAETQEAKIVGDATTKLELKSLETVNGADNRGKDQRPANGSGE